MGRLCSWAMALTAPRVMCRSGWCGWPVRNCRLRFWTTGVRARTMARAARIGTRIPMTRTVIPTRWTRRLGAMMADWYDPYAPPYDVPCPRESCQAQPGLGCVAEYQGRERTVEPHP